MDWWSAENFCAAQNKDMPTIDSFACYQNGTSTVITAGTSNIGRCCKDASGECSSYWFDSTQRAAHFSSKIVSVKNALGGGQYVWTQSVTNNSCTAFSVYLGSGNVIASARYNPNVALCE